MVLPFFLCAVSGVHITDNRKLKKMDLSVVPLHKYPEYTLDSCKLINDEWKRSETARLRSLSSCDTLPTCLILLQNKSVIGHLKLRSIPRIKEAVFVESVVIKRTLRGKGLGTILMRQAEKYCSDFLNKTIVYLSTNGQERFYRKLGYTECPPVSIYGGSSLQNGIMSIDKSNIKTEAKIGPPPPPLPKYSVGTQGITYMKKEL